MGILNSQFTYVRVSASTFTVSLEFTPSVGNTLIMAVGGNGNSNYFPAFPTSPSGWTQLGPTASSGGGEASAVLIGYRVVRSGDSNTFTLTGTAQFPQDSFIAIWEARGAPALTGNAHSVLGAPVGQIPTEVITPAANTFVAVMYIMGGSITFSSVTPNPPYGIRHTQIGTSPVSAAMVDADQSFILPSAVTANFTGTAASDPLWAYAVVPVLSPPPLISFQTQPGFFDIQDSVLACGNPLADYDLLKFKYNSDLAAVRPEAFFSGYFTDQDTLPLPVSAVDAYTYSLTESLYYFQLSSTKGPQPGFTPGQELFPPPDFSGHPIDGFLVNPYQLEPNFGTLTQAGFSTEKQLTLRSLFYEHGDVQTSSPEESYPAGISAAFCFGQRRSATLDPILPGPVYQTTSTPVFYDLPNSAIVDGVPITDQMMQAISRNAKLGVFRFEIFFMGYYRNGDTVPNPVGAGNYRYSYPECIFMPLLGSSRQPTGDFVPGQVYFPQLANLDVYKYPASSFPEQLLISSTGQVTCTINGANGVQGQGSVAVYCFAQRYPSLTMASQPSYTTISDGDLVGGQVPTAGLLQDLNNNAKFGIVAKEAFWMGYFADGNQLNPPTSPVDGYSYQHYEMLYMPVWVSSNQPTGLTPGQKTWPSTTNPWSTTTTHDGNTIPFIVAAPYKCFVNQYVSPFGQLTSKGFDGNNGAISTGIVSVYAIGCRQQNPTGTTL